MLRARRVGAVLDGRVASGLIYARESNSSRRPRRTCGPRGQDAAGLRGCCWRPYCERLPRPFRLRLARLGALLYRRSAAAPPSPNTSRRLNN